MALKLTIRKGLEEDLPILTIGELGFCTDTNKLFIGTGSGNFLVNVFLQEDIYIMEFLRNLSFEAHTPEEMADQINMIVNAFRNYPEGVDLKALLDSKATIHTGENPPSNEEDFWIKIL